jgi:hypothetical protein
MDGRKVFAGQPFPPKPPSCKEPLYGPTDSSLGQPDGSQTRFWTNRWEAGKTPWDWGGIPPALASFFARGEPPTRVLIPGCGSAYEVKTFHGTLAGVGENRRSFLVSGWLSLILGKSFEQISQLLLGRYGLIHGTSNLFLHQFSETFTQSVDGHLDRTFA